MTIQNAVIVILKPLKGWRSVPAISMNANCPREHMPSFHIRMEWTTKFIAPCGFYCPVTRYSHSLTAELGTLISLWFSRQIRSVSVRLSCQQRSRQIGITVSRVGCSFLAFPAWVWNNVPSKHWRLLSASGPALQQTALACSAGLRVWHVCQLCTRVNTRWLVLL